jgi:putative redox protein
VAERASEDPKVFTKIEYRFRISGRNLPHAAVQRAVQLSHDKYCSATAMLAHTAKIDTSFKIIETGAA